MSEIKGQLLGILLAAMVFTLVGGAIYGIFTTLSSTVENKVSDAITAPEVIAPAAYDPVLLTY